MCCMSIFSWRPEYSVGSAQIDLQHKQIFRMADELHSAMVAGQELETIEGLLDRFVAYTRFHFTSEERYMQESEYPGCDQHHEFHEKLLLKVEDFQNKMKSRRVAVPMELTRFLRDFLDGHVQREDLRFGRYLKSLSAAKTG